MRLHVFLMVYRYCVNHKLLKVIFIQHENCVVCKVYKCMFILNISRIANKHSNLFTCYCAWFVLV